MSNLTTCGFCKVQLPQSIIDQHLLIVHGYGERGVRPMKTAEEVVDKIISQIYKETERYFVRHLICDALTAFAEERVEDARIKWFEKSASQNLVAWMQAKAEAYEEAAKVFPECAGDHSKLPLGLGCFYCFYGDKIRALEEKL